MYSVQGTPSIYSRGRIIGGKKMNKTRSPPSCHVPFSEDSEKLYSHLLQRVRCEGLPDLVCWHVYTHTYTHTHTHTRTHVHMHTHTYIRQGAQLTFFFLMAASVAYGNSHSRHWIQVATVTYATSAVTLDPLTHYPRPGLQPVPLQWPKPLQSYS